MTILPEIRDKKDEEVVEEEEEEDDEVVFDQTPVRVQCPHCGGSIITFIEYESSWTTYTMGLVLWVGLGWASLCVVPILWPLFKDVVHHCPRCLNVLATKSRVVIPSFNQPVMTFKVGSCAVVLARRYVLALCALVGVIFTIHSLRTSSFGQTDVVPRGATSPAGWDAFLKDCGYKSYLGNPIHVSTAFEEKYRNRTFHWQGVVKRYEEPFSFIGWHYDGRILVRMEPSQLPMKKEFADVVLTFGSANEAIKVGSLKQGVAVRFEATMYRVGKRGAPHAMALWSLNPLPADQQPKSDVHGRNATSVRDR